MAKPKRKKKKETPVCAALESTSRLRPEVRVGLGAVKVAHRNYLANDVRTAFGDSLDLDAAFQSEYPGENRWDYLLGHTATKEVIGVEPHSAKQDEISTVIRKRAAAKQQLYRHLKPGKRHGRAAKAPMKKGATTARVSRARNHAARSPIGAGPPTVLAIMTAPARIASRHTG